VPAVKVDSNFREFMTASFPSAPGREERIKTALERTGRVYIANVQRKYLSGRPGLKRQTGTLARSFKSNVTGSLASGMKLNVFLLSQAFYGLFHSDDYVPASGERRFPVRLETAAEWTAMTAPSGPFQTVMVVAWLGVPQAKALGIDTSITETFGAPTNAAAMKIARTQGKLYNQAAREKAQAELSRRRVDKQLKKIARQRGKKDST
jgi:hypothetical protein